MKTFRTVWLLRIMNLDCELFLRDGKNDAFLKVYHLSPLQANHGKHHSMRAHKPQAVSD